MIVLSLFDGLGSGRLALQRAGLPVERYLASEIEPKAMSVAMKHFPDIEQIGDVTKVRGDTLPKIDLLLGGSPCQGISKAGHMLKMEDPRSKLFAEYVRLLLEVRPKWFLFENVVSSADIVDLMSLCLGRRPVKLNSAILSAQSRERLYWTNIPFDTPEDLGIQLQDVLESGEACRPKSQTIVATIHKENAKSMLKRGKMGLLVRDPSKPMGYRKLSVLECERLQTLPDGYTEGVSNTARYKMIGEGWTVDIITHILSALNVDE